MSRRPVRNQNMLAFVSTVFFVCAVLVGVRDTLTVDELENFMIELRRDG